VERTTVDLYERHATEWARRRGPANDDLGLRFRRTVGAGLVLDAGCGPGRYLAQLGSPVVGLDVTGGMLRVARRAGSPLVHGDLEALPFPAGTFAGLFARHSYLHLPKARLPAALADARRVLAPGGLLLLTMIPGDHEGPARAGDDFPGRWFALWRAEELAGALGVAGFGAVEISTVREQDGEDLFATGRSA
jgi:SAM-dependent methyltransferase